MTTAVTVTQLRNLTDRAATGLTLDEQQRLRDGIDRLERAEAAIERVRRLCALTITHSIRVHAVEQAHDTLTALDQKPPAHNDGPTVREAAADDRRWPLQKTGE